MKHKEKNNLTKTFSPLGHCKTTNITLLISPIKKKTIKKKYNTKKVVKKVPKQVERILKVLKKYVYLTNDGIEITLSKEQRKDIVKEYILEVNKNNKNNNNTNSNNNIYLDTWHKIRRALTDKKLWRNPYKGGHSKHLHNISDVKFIFTNLSDVHIKLLEMDNKLFT